MTTAKNKSPPKHTPGPWEIHHGDDYLTVEGPNKRSCFTQQIVIIREPNKSDEGNAILIASAPDMKEAGTELHEALFFLRKAYSDVQKHYGFKPEQSDHIVKATAALKKWTAAIKKVGASS